MPLLLPAHSRVERVELGRPIPHLPSLPVSGPLHCRLYCVLFATPCHRSGTGNTIRATEVYGVGCSGMTVTSGDRTTLAPGNTAVEGNTLHDFSLWKRMHVKARPPVSFARRACVSRIGNVCLSMFRQLGRPCALQGHCVPIGGG